MEKGFEQKKKVEKKENVVGKVVRTLFGGDYEKFSKNVEISYDQKEFIVGTASFMRSVVGQVQLNTREYSEVQKAIRMEISKIKKERKKEAERLLEQREQEAEFIEIAEEDKAMTDKIRNRILRGASQKEANEKAYYKKHGLKDPGDPGE